MRCAYGARGCDPAGRVCGFLAANEEEEEEEEEAEGAVPMGCTVNQSPKHIVMYYDTVYVGINSLRVCLFF